MRCRRSFFASVLEGRRWRREGARALLPLLLAPFLILFLFTSLPRIWVPFELEWNEGQSAEQALRFATDRPLYPAPGGDWVPYMYAPMYHIVWGGAMRLGVGAGLAVGRIVSLLATLAAALAIAEIVFDRSRRVTIAAAGALLYFAFFKAGGYWYDLARTDSLAIALTAWGMHLTLRRGASARQIAVGMVLLVLAALTKQTMALAGLCCGVIALVSAPSRARWGIVGAALVFANAMMILHALGNDGLLHYTVENALSHAQNPAVFFPHYRGPDDFLAMVPLPHSALAVARAYLEQSRDSTPLVWDDFVRHVWVLGALVASWACFAAVRASRRRGLVLLLPLAGLVAGSVAGYSKAGGFLNNFMPAYLGLAVVVPLAFEGFLPARARAASCIGLVLLIALQIVQPWSVPSRAERAAAGRPELERWMAPGLIWLPSQEQPARESDAAFANLMKWLRARHAAGEPVWVMHHQWYGALAGHEVGPNIDMVRCAEYAGDKPGDLIAAQLRSKRWRWLVLDMDSINDDWLPSGVASVIIENYEFVGPVPGLEDIGDGRALLPLTGAMMRPLSVWRLRK